MIMMVMMIMMMRMVMLLPIMMMMVAMMIMVMMMMYCKEPVTIAESLHRVIHGAESAHSKPDILPSSTNEMF